jgi:hypothetical protein
MIFIGNSKAVRSASRPLPLPAAQFILTRLEDALLSVAYSKFDKESLRVAAITPN